MSFSSVEEMEVFFKNCLSLIRLIKLGSAYRSTLRKTIKIGLLRIDQLIRTLKKIVTIKKIIKTSELFFPIYFEVAEVTGHLKNGGKIEKRGGKIILNILCANKDPIKMMES